MGAIRRKTNGHSTPEQIKPKTNRPKTLSVCVRAITRGAQRVRSSCLHDASYLKHGISLFFKMWLEVVFSTTKTLVTHTILITLGLVFLKLLQYKSFAVQSASGL